MLLFQLQDRTYSWLTVIFFVCRIESFSSRTLNFRPHRVHCFAVCVSVCVLDTRVNSARKPVWGRLVGSRNHVFGLHSGSSCDAASYQITLTSCFFGCKSFLPCFLSFIFTCLYVSNPCREVTHTHSNLSNRSGERSSMPKYIWRFQTWKAFVRQQLWVHIAYIEMTDKSSIARACSTHAAPA